MTSQLFSLVLAFTAVLSAQDFPSSSMLVENGRVIALYGPPRAIPVVTGAPYSADRLQEYTPSGSTEPSRSSVIGHFARDSSGRTRSSVAMKAAPLWLTTIFDPVAGVAYLLDEDAKVAHRMALATPAPPRAIAGRPKFKTESLGMQSIDGIPAEGTRVSGPLTIETWASPALKIDLAVRSSNGYSGRMIRLSRTEPDPALFRPPSDYRVVDETAPFPMSTRAR